MVQVTISNIIKIEGLPVVFQEEVKNYLTLKNPVYEKMLKRNNPKALYALKKNYVYYREEGDILFIGRGNKQWLLNLFIRENIPFTVKEMTTEPRLPSDIQLSGLKLRDYQVGVAEQITFHSNGVVKLGTGFGKCHGKGTKILMYNGTVKKVEDIKVGDQLMGDDSRPRNVLSLARGREEMYKIIPRRGEPFVCNKSHILSLKSTPRKKGEERRLVNISIKDYLNKNNRFKHIHKLWKTGVNFKEKEIELDPYFVGLWLGDGVNRTSEIGNPDWEVEKYLEKYAEKMGLYFRKSFCKERSCPILHITRKLDRSKNPIVSRLRKYNLIKNKHIPFDYKVNSRENRLRLLAGLIDSDGYRKMTGYEIVTKYGQLKDDILFLCNSLGYATHYKLKKGEIKSLGFSDYYHRILINGDLSDVPIKIERKKPQKRKQKKDINVTGFSIESLGEDDYYGFEIDGNHLYLLDNFFVTHNTIIAIQLINLLRKNTLIILPRTNLLNQFKYEVKKYFNYKAGIIQGNKWEVKPITLASSATLKKRDLTSIQDYFGMVIFDECHTTISDKGIKLASSFNCKYLYGMSATPERTEDDGRTRAVFFTFGDILINKELPQKKPLVESILTHIEIEPSYEYAEIIDKQIENQDRLDLVIRIIKDELLENRKILILTKRIAHYTTLAERLKDYKVYSISSTGTAQEKRHQTELLRKMREGECDFQVILGTYSMLSTGVDIPALDTLIFAGDIKASLLVKQSAGRIMRLFEGKQNPKVIDIVDNKSPILFNQFRKRLSFYKQSGWLVMTKDNTL